MNTQKMQWRVFIAVGLFANPAFQITLSQYLSG